MIATPPARLAVWTLAILAVFFTLDLAEPLLAPILLGLVQGVVLTPIANGIARTGLPDALGAFLTVIVALLLIAGILLMLGPYLSAAIARAPEIWGELRLTVTDFQATLRGLDEMREGVADAIGEGSAAGAEAGSEEGVEVPTITEMLLYAPSIAARSLVFVGTLYFFLLVRTDIYDRIGRSSLSVSKGDLCEAENEVSRYFLTITMINASFGALVTLALLLLGMPSPMVWGVVAFLANFILYLGPALYACALVVGGLVAFDGAYAILPAALYIGMNMTEGQFVTPSLVGRQMSVNPLAVFLSLCVWLWMWGPLGGIIAIPLLVWGMAIHRRRVARAQTIASGTPGRLRPNSRAGATG